MKTTKRMCISIAALMLLILTGCNQKEKPANNQEQKPDNREISGTVYIMTAGAETIRLPMVQIVAFDITSNVAQKIIDTERQTAEQKLNENGKSLLAHYAVVELDRIIIEDSREAHNVGTNLDNSFADAKTNLTTAISEWEKWQNEIQPAYYGNIAFEKMGKPIPISTTDVDGKFSAQIQTTDMLLAATAQRQIPAGTETYFWLIPIPAGGEKINIELNNKTLLEYSPETQLMIQKTTADASKMKSEIDTWLSGASVP
jgi:hypothetical protein